MRAAHALALVASVSLGSWGGCIYANVNRPLSYRSPTPSDVGGQVGQMGEDVDGSACNHVVLGLVAWGDGGYTAAIDDALHASGAKLLADVRADTSSFNILGVYQKQCTRVRGRAVR